MGKDGFTLITYLYYTTQFCGLSVTRPSSMCQDFLGRVYITPFTALFFVHCFGYRASLGGLDFLVTF